MRSAPPDRDDLPEDVLKQMADCTTPWLIGVRHHSAALARGLPFLLDQYQPEAILLEMPPDFQRWLHYLGLPELEAPVALAACGDAKLLSFYPLADFSPELAAIRWADRHDVSVTLCDLDLTSMALLDSQEIPDENQSIGTSWLERLLAKTGVRDTGELWDKMVETPAVGSSPESIRRAALQFGWMIRHSSGGPSFHDVHREAAMRAAIQSAPTRTAVIVGAFHAAALLPEPVLWSAPAPLKQQAAGSPPKTLDTSLIPYSFTQLDQRSGYPAGIMDPVWQQSMLQVETVAAGNELVVDLAVKLCRELRQAGHVAGTPDAMEVVRFARDLSQLRGYQVPGRAEFLEAVETALVQGELLGRGRAVAAAAQTVLVGSKTGQLPAGTPRSGLALQIEAAIKRLKLPGPDSVSHEPRELRLDPLRSPLDRARAVVLRRLCLLNLSYAQRKDSAQTGHRENLTEVWRVQWTHATAATVEASGINGATLDQACQAFIQRIQHQAADGVESETQHPATLLARLNVAAECGLGNITKSLLLELQATFMQAASPSQLIEAASLLQRISAGHISGLPLDAEDAVPPDVELFQVQPELLKLRPLVETALSHLKGLLGSTDPADVILLTDLAAMITGELSGSVAGNQELSSLLPALRDQLSRLSRQGSPLMQGAAWGAQVAADLIAADVFQACLAGWYDAASTHEGRTKVSLRLNGLLVPLLPLVSVDPVWLSGLAERLGDSADDEFLVRLPALRKGFLSISPADRVRLLRDRLLILEPDGPRGSHLHHLENPERLAQSLVADRKGREAIANLFPDFPLRQLNIKDPFAKPIRVAEAPGEIPLADRWRLILGVKGCSTPKSQQVAGTLDQLYGGSEREGRGLQGDLASDRGGTEAAAPSVREWISDVERLFGKDVCEEVLGEAAVNGRAAVLEHLNHATVRPSVELLEQVLSLRGALSERELGLLRKLARNITERMAKQLANRLRPALHGLSIARPTRRRSPRLDFARTLNSNLHTAYRKSDGRISIAPTRLVYRLPAKRQMDWHLIFVVDVSGSMEASVIYSSMMAAIFSALPAIDVKFFAFSTQVIDFTGRVEDPLSLLMEIQIGGGTHIGLGLRAARESITNPSRTLVVLVTDFEEGVSVPELLSEVVMLSSSGAKLIGLAALNDEAKPRYHAGTAAAVVQAGMPVAAVSPERLAEWVGDQIRGGTA
ncbi:DUF5682 family protein [Gimesia maris]|uniref:VWA domain containing CoxE-like protein n=1 Tax=Gimesia maris TaxID=122 RepID=A0ABX5YNY4_9PLAN|nr:DUF5682 family protein [Gimesia maris]EDL62254.1 hypothetical protein PM8797T_28039 [Gimesia maris DSM 8797]QEG17342.1 VWA domain containing CoxE-like protein [Gimesia maris]QGQ29567.1 VWA domain-containing protein [Gimesia maris]